MGGNVLANIMKFEEKGLTKRTIDSIQDRPRSGDILNHLVNTNGTVVTDPWDVHCVATEHYRKTFSRKPQFTGGLHDEDCDWMGMLNSKTVFLEAHDHTNIPVDLVELIWEAMQVPDAIKYEQLAAIEPTLEEFENAIKFSNSGCGGPSQETFAMAREWPPPVVERVFDLLLVTWRTKYVPEHFKVKILVPIPKQLDTCDIALTRPLNMLEVKRKLWVSIIMRRMKHFWRKNNVLDPSQHAYMSHKGTETASLEFIHILETSLVSNSDLFVSSYDIAGAFDSIGKPIQRLSWYRSHKNLELANYIVDLDIDGSTIVRSPYAIKKLEDLGYHDLIRNTPSFPSEIGGMQGDVPSAYAWTTMDDILLAALRMDLAASKYTGCLWVRDARGHLKPASDISYSDDLAVPTPNQPTLQRKTDIICAFCIIFGLVLAKHKLRALVKCSNLADEQAEFVVHDVGWTPVTIHLQDGGEMKYLGAVYPIGSNAYTSIHQKALELADKTCAIIASKRASAGIKLGVAKVSLVQKILYDGKFACLPLAAYRQLDPFMLRLAKRSTRVMNSIATDLIFQPKQWGMGVERISDTIQYAKEAMLFRSLNHASSRDTTAGILQNAQVSGTYQGQAATFSHEKPGVFSSLFEFAENCGLMLHKSGWSGTDTSCESLSSYVSRSPLSYTPREDILSTAKTIDANNIGDFLEYNTTLQTNTWPFWVGNLAALNHLHCRSPPQDILTIYTGMFFLFFVGTINERLIENLGLVSKTVIDEDAIFTLEYQPVRLTCNLCAVGLCPQTSCHSTSYAPCAASTRRGAGSTTYCMIADLLPTDEAFTQAIPYKARLPGGVVAIAFCTSKKPYNLKHAPSPSYWETVTQDIVDRPRGSSLTSDGGFTADSSLPGLMNRIMCRPVASSATASVVNVDHDMKTAKSIRILNVGALNPRSAFPVELLGIAATTDIRHRSPVDVETFSDCESAINVSNAWWIAHKNYKKEHWPIIQFIANRMASGCQSSGTPLNPVQWLKGHPERTEKDSSKWNHGQIQMALADDVASDHVSGSLVGYNNDTTDIDVKVFLDHIASQAGTYMWKEGENICLDSLKVINETKNMTSYLTMRDTKRMEEGRRQKWNGLPFDLASKVSGISKMAVKKSLNTLRHWFDRWQHGKNQARQEKSTMTIMCRLCEVAADNQEHYIRSCNHKDIAACRLHCLRATAAIINRQRIPQLSELAIKLMDLALNDTHVLDNVADVHSPVVNPFHPALLRKTNPDGWCLPASVLLALDLPAEDMDILLLLRQLRQFVHENPYAPMPADYADTGAGDDVITHLTMYLEKNKIIVRDSNQDPQVITLSVEGYLQLISRDKKRISPGVYTVTCWPEAGAIGILLSAVLETDITVVDCNNEIIATYIYPNNPPDCPKVCLVYVGDNHFDYLITPTEPMDGLSELEEPMMNPAVYNRGLSLWTGMINPPDEAEIRRLVNKPFFMQECNSKRLYHLSILLWRSCPTLCRQSGTCDAN